MKNYNPYWMKIYHYNATYLYIYKEKIEFISIIKVFNIFRRISIIMIILTNYYS